MPRGVLPETSWGPASPVASKRWWSRLPGAGWWKEGGQRPKARTQAGLEVMGPGGMSSPAASAPAVFPVLAGPLHSRTPPQVGGAPQKW